MIQKLQYACTFVAVMAVSLIAIAQDGGGDVEVGDGGGATSGSKTVEGDYSKSQSGVDDASASNPDFPIQDFWIKPIAIGIHDKLPKNANTPPASLVFYNTRNQLGGAKHPDDTTTEEVAEHETSDAPHHHRRREMHQRIRDREEEMEAMTARVTKRRHVSMEAVLKPQALLVEKKPDRMRDDDNNGGLLGGGIPMMEKKKKRRGGALGGKGRRRGGSRRKSRSLPAPDGTGSSPNDKDDDDNEGAGTVDDDVDATFKTVLTYIPFSPNSPIHDITSEHMDTVLSYGEVDTGLLGGGGGSRGGDMELVGYRATSPSDHRPIVTFLKVYFPESPSLSVFPDEVIHTTGYTDVELRKWFNETSIPLKHAKALAIVNHAPQLRKLVGGSIATRPLDVEVEAPPAAIIEEGVVDPSPSEEEIHDPHEHGIHRLARHDRLRHHNNRRGRRGGRYTAAEFGGAILLSDYHIVLAVASLKEALYSRISGDSALNGRAREALTSFVEKNLSRYKIVSRIPTSDEVAQHQVEAELREKAEEAEMDQVEKKRFRQTNELKKKQQLEHQQGSRRHMLPHMGLGGRGLMMGGEEAEVDHTNQGRNEVTVVAFAIMKTA